MPVSNVTSELSETDITTGVRSELWLALAYFTLYVAYLFYHPESEAEHWISIVVIPLILLAGFGRYRSDVWELRRTLSSVGLSRAGSTGGSGRLYFSELCCRSVNWSSAAKRMKPFS